MQGLRPGGGGWPREVVSPEPRLEVTAQGNGAPGGRTGGQAASHPHLVLRLVRPEGEGPGDAAPWGEPTAGTGSQGAWG